MENDNPELNSKLKGTHLSKKIDDNIKALKKKSHKNTSVPDNENLSTPSTSNANSVLSNKFKPNKTPKHFVEKGKMKEKHDKAAPFYMFFSSVESAPETHNDPLSITFQELLDRSLGNLNSSLHINHMVNIDWLLKQYITADYSDKNLTILHGNKQTQDINSIYSAKPNVKPYLIEMKNEKETTHAKISILHYKDDSVRIVVLTANLLPSEWKEKTQGLWLSPRCPHLPKPYFTKDGESPTGFKKSLIDFLEYFQMPCLSQYIDLVKGIDFSSINVFFVVSMPGKHINSQWGLSLISSILSKHCVIPIEEITQWNIVAQTSGIGNFGRNPEEWLLNTFLCNFCSSSKKRYPKMDDLPNFQLIYPTQTNVAESHENSNGGRGLGYSTTVHTQQQWLNKMLYQWSAVHSGRNQSIPMMKSYLRLSPDGKRAAFFLLTTANIMKSTWGAMDKRTNSTQINSIETGVLFLPKLVVNKEHFSVDINDPNRLPIPYDLPPIPYNRKDTPHVNNYNPKKFKK